MKKAFLSVFTIVVCLVLVVLPSAGWLTDLDKKSNQLQIADMTVEISEQLTEPENGVVQPGIPYQNVIRIQNTTNAPVLVRVMALPELVQEETLLEAVAQLDINREDWEDGKDGFFYYKQALPPGELSSPVFESVLIPEDSIEASAQNAVFQIAVRSEACGITTDYGHITAWFGGEEPTGEPLKNIHEMLKEIADRNGGGA